MSKTLPFTFTDLSNDEEGRQIYLATLHNWWPHPLHGGVAVSVNANATVMKCLCGEELHVDHDHAEAVLGI